MALPWPSVALIRSLRHSKPSTIWLVLAFRAKHHMAGVSFPRLAIDGVGGQMKSDFGAWAAVVSVSTFQTPER